MIIEHTTIHVHNDAQQDSPDIVMTNSDFIKGYEQALNSREFRATRFFTDADIVGILNDFMQEPHDETDMQYHAGQITGLIAVRCLTRAYPREIDEHRPLQGYPHAPQQGMDTPAYGSRVMTSDWPNGTFDAVFDMTSERGAELELSFTRPDAADVTPSALLRLKQYDIILLRDFLNQSQITAWLAS